MSNTAEWLVTFFSFDSQRVYEQFNCQMDYGRIHVPRSNGRTNNKASYKLPVLLLPDWRVDPRDVCFTWESFPSGATQATSSIRPLLVAVCLSVLHVVILDLANFWLLYRTRYYFVRSCNDGGKRCIDAQLMQRMTTC